LIKIIVDSKLGTPPSITFGRPDRWFRRQTVLPKLPLVTFGTVFRFRITLCNQVSIDEVFAVSVFRKKRASERGLPHTVWSRYYVELHQTSYPTILRDVILAGACWRQSDVNKKRRVCATWLLGQNDPGTGHSHLANLVN
jgi:hypothetical protein